jgi:hypothetical protein
LDSELRQKKTRNKEGGVAKKEGKDDVKLLD